MRNFYSNMKVNGRHLLESRTEIIKTGTYVSEFIPKVKALLLSLCL